MTLTYINPNDSEYKCDLTVPACGGVGQTNGDTSSDEICFKYDNNIDPWARPCLMWSKYHIYPLWFNFIYRLNKAKYLAYPWSS